MSRFDVEVKNNRAIIWDGEADDRWVVEFFFDQFSCEEQAIKFANVLCAIMNAGL